MSNKINQSNKKLALVFTTSLLLILLLLSTVVSAEKVKVNDKIKECKDKYYISNPFLYGRTIFNYDNTTCKECSDYITKEIESYIIEVNDCFPNIKSTLAICLFDLSVLQEFTAEEFQSFVVNCSTKAELEYLNLTREDDDKGLGPIRVRLSDGLIAETSSYADPPLTIYHLFPYSWEPLLHLVAKNPEMSRVISNKMRLIMPNQSQADPRFEGLLIKWQKELDSLKVAEASCPSNCTYIIDARKKAEGKVRSAQKRVKSITKLDEVDKTTDAYKEHKAFAEMSGEKKAEYMWDKIDVMAETEILKEEVTEAVENIEITSEQPETTSEPVAKEPEPKKEGVFSRLRGWFRNIFGF